MRVSIRRSFGESPTVHDLPWSHPSPNEDSVVVLYREWLRHPMKGPTPTEKPSDLWLISFCAFDQNDSKGPPGCRRGNMNPEGLHAIALDFDDADPGVFARVLGKAKEMSPQGLVHTTWKHGLAPANRVHTQDVTRVRARIVMPIIANNGTRNIPVSIPADHWRPYWDAVCKAVGANEPGSGLDTQCHNPERLWYLPCTNLDAPAWAPHLEVWG